MIRDKFKQFQEKYLMKATLAAMIVGLLFVFFSPRIIVIVPAGSVGVLFRPLSNGTDLETVLGEGAHLVFPWNDVAMYDTRLQAIDQKFNMITKDGLAVETVIEIRYRVNPKHVGLLHQTVGINYLEVMLTPEVAANAREVVAHYDAEEFYSVKRAQVQREIFEHTRADIVHQNAYSPEGVILVELDEVMIKGITLPPIVAASIERKVEQYHRLLEYDFRLQTEAKEAKRKEIEGQGVADLFAKVGQRDIQSYLRLAGIEAMVKVAQSPGSRVVIVGDGKGGTPVIVSPEASSAPAAAPAPARAPK